MTCAIGICLCQDTIFALHASFMPELFGTDARYSGISLGFQVDAAIGEGLRPVIAAGIVARTGATSGISLILVALGILTVIAILSTCETATRASAGEVDRTEGDTGGGVGTWLLPMTQADPDELARTSAIDFARHLVHHWQEELGTELLGAYLIGSLGHGGFSRRYSDVDIALITAAELSPQTLDRLRRHAVALSAEWEARLSVFWTDRHFSTGRFPPLDRIDYLDHALALMENERVRPARPTLQEVRDYLRGAPFANWADYARSFAVAETLEPKKHKAYLRTLLYPGRFCYSWMTGLIGSNDDAVAFLRERPVAGLDISLIVRALQCRKMAADPDALFPVRTMLPSQVDACAALLASGGHPLR